MNYNKFYNFVQEIAKDDKALAEAVIAGHKAILEQAIQEGYFGKLGHTAAKAAMPMLMAAGIGANPAHAWSPFGDSKPVVSHQQQIENEAKEKIDNVVMAATTGGDIVDAPETEELVEYIKSLSAQEQQDVMKQLQNASKGLASFNGKNLNTIIAQLVYGSDYRIVSK